MFLDPSAKLLTQKRTRTFDREQEHDGGANGKAAPGAEPPMGWVVPWPAPQVSIF
jgi:hypothetical protein